MDLQPRQRAVALAAVLLLAPGAAHADTGVAGRFGARPAVPRGQGQAPPYFDLQGEPGTVEHHSAIVVNGTSETKRLIVSSVDGLTGQTTGVVYANREDAVTEAGRWVTPSTGEIDVPPDSRRSVKFTLRVPAGARPGDHLAGLAFEDEHTSTSKSRFSVKQIVRVVVGVQVTVPGGSGPHGTLGALNLRPQVGTQVATTAVQLGNSGDRLCHPKMRVTLSADGAAPRVIEKQLDTVLPGDQVDYPMAFPGAMAAGTYAAEVRLFDCGPAETATGKLTLAKNLSGSSPRAALTGSGGSHGSGPSAMALIGLVVLGILAGIGGILGAQILVGRRRRGAAEAV